MKVDILPQHALLTATQEYFLGRLRTNLYNKTKGLNLREAARRW